MTTTCQHCHLDLELAAIDFPYGTLPVWVAPKYDRAPEACPASDSPNGDHEPDALDRDAEIRLSAELVVHARAMLTFAAQLDPDRCPPACSDSHTGIAPCAWASRAVVPDPMTITTGPIDIQGDGGDVLALETKSIRVSAKPTEHLR